MESVGSPSSSAGAVAFLVVPEPNYLDFDVDLDDDDEEVVIGIRPKSSPQPRRKTSVSEDESDISEPPSLSGSRRVSFADAVGLNLVQVKEFDKWDVPQIPNFSDDPNINEDSYYISPFNFLISPPSEDILAKVLDQKVELESIELLPGTTILKGVIRVLNISFTKAVFVRTSLDNWVSHFDLLSEYVPGSSDGHLDRFAFKLTLVPPFAEQGARVDFCLRYETPNGTFWDNNSNKNYVLFCQKRKKIVLDKPQKEIVNKKSCLKTVSRSFSVEESMSSPEQENFADVTTQRKIISESQTDQSDNNPVKPEEDANSSQVENRRNRSRRSRRKAARTARVRDGFAHKDLTTDSESLTSSEKPLPTAQDQIQATDHSNPQGSVRLEHTADRSMSKDSNSKTHESFSLANAATLANDRRDESKDTPNDFISTSEMTSAEEASRRGHLSGERDDSERLVSDSSGFAFGTVVAPLYHEVSGRGAGSQPDGEMYNSSSTKEQRERTEERSRDADGTLCKGCCWNDGKAESSEQSISRKDESLNAFNSSGSAKIPDSTEVKTNAVSDPVHPKDFLNWDLVNASEKVLDHENKIQNSYSCLEQKTFANEAFQIHMSENSCIGMKGDEGILKSEKQDCQFELDKQSCQPSNVSDIHGPSLENSDTNTTLLPNKLLFQEQNASVSLEISQNACSQEELANDTLDVSSKDLKYEENISLPFQSSQNKDLVNQSASINDIIVFPSQDMEPCSVLSLQSSQNDELKTSNAMDENSLQFEDQCRVVSLNTVSGTPANTNKSLTLEHSLAETLSNQPTNTNNLFNEQNPASSASIVIVSPISEEENTQLSSQLSQNVDWPDHHNESIVFEEQSLALSPTCTFEIPEKQFLLIEQNTSLGDQTSNTSDSSLDAEGAQTAPSTHPSKLSSDRNAMKSAQSYTCGILLQKEDLEGTAHSDLTIQRQELCGTVEESACSLLLINSCLQENSTSHSNFIDCKCDGEAGSVAVTSSLVSESLEEYQPRQEDKVTHEDEQSVENDKKMLAISSNLTISGVGNGSQFVQITQNDISSGNTSDPVINLVLDQRLIDGQESTMDENLPFHTQDQFKYSSIGFRDEPSNPNSLLIRHEAAPLDPVQDFTKAVAILDKDKKLCNASFEIVDVEIIANPGIYFGKLDDTKGCVENELKETSKCNEDDINESIQIDTMDFTLEDEAKTWGVMAEKEQENVGLQAASEDVVDVMTNSVDDVDKLKSSDSKTDDVELSEMAGSQKIDFESASEDIEKKKVDLEELDLDAQVNIETYFAPVFEDGIPNVCTSYEESVKESASVKKKQLNEGIESTVMHSLDDMQVDGMEKVKVQLKTNEEERFKIPPRRVKRKLSAPGDNVQESIRSSQDKIVDEKTYMPVEMDKRHFICRSKDTNDNTLAGDLKCDQNSDNDIHSESESGSDDEMELYMHCLRAVYGQQSSPKATNPAQNRAEGFKRLPSIKTKRLSTSLPSISESLDEEQPVDIINIRESQIEAVTEALPNSNPQEENVDCLWWRQSFSCKNILKSLLYATLVVIFVAVAYHYDFIACFGLYVMSLIWLFFQGDRQTEKNNRVS